MAHQSLFFPRPVSVFPLSVCFSSPLRNRPAQVPQQAASPHPPLPPLSLTCRDHSSVAYASSTSHRKRAGLPIGSQIPIRTGFPATRAQPSLFKPLASPQFSPFPSGPRKEALAVSSIENRILSITFSASARKQHTSEPCRSAPDAWVSSLFPPLRSCGLDFVFDARFRENSSRRRAPRWFSMAPPRRSPIPAAGPRRDLPDELRAVRWRSNGHE
jgi:hypothetical protein